MSLNLLPSQAKFQAEKIKQKTMVTKIVIWLTSIWMVMIVVVVIANFTAGYRANAAANGLKTAQDSYMAMADDIKISQQLKYKAKLVGSSLGARFEYGKSFELIQSLFPEGITLTKYELKNRGTFEVTGKTSGRENVDKLEEIIDVTNSGANPELTKCKLTTLTVKDGVWTFSMEVTLK